MAARFILIAALLLAPMAVHADAPATTPATLPNDELMRLRKMVLAMRDEMAALRTENAKLKADLKKAQAQIPKPQAAGPVPNNISVGMSRADAEAVSEKRKWTYDATTSESLEHGKVVRRERWEFRFAGEPIRVEFENDIVVRVEK